MMVLQSYTLKNGLRVLLIDTKAFPTLTTILLFGAGSRYENQKNNGIAHFFEHIVFKGSTKYPSSFAISSLLEGMGAVNNAFTSKDHTGYYVKGTVKYFEESLDILSDMIINPLLKPEEIEREKGVIVEEINMYEDQPQRKVGELFEELLYKGNALGYDIAGTKETVTKFSRQTFLDYMGKLYSPKNAMLVVAGGLNVGENFNSPEKRAIRESLQKYINIIEEKFAKWNSVHPSGVQARFEPVTENQKKPATLIKYKKTEQTHFSLGFRTFSFKDPRKYALSILATILGGGMSSRLFIEVRERRGLCYYISTGRETYHDVGYMVTQAGVTNDKDKIKEAISVILAEHKKIVDGKVTDEEVKRAKEMIKGRILLSMEDSSSVASWHGTKLILEGKIDTVEEVIKKIGTVKKEEIISLARGIFTSEKLNLALIGPFEKLDLSLYL